MQLKIIEFSVTVEHVEAKVIKLLARYVQSNETITIDKYLRSKLTFAFTVKVKYIGKSSVDLY